MDIQREIAINKRLLHPNICRFFDVVETKNRIYLVMELVEGGYTMRDMIADKYSGTGMDEMSACGIFRQVLIFCICVLR